MNDKRILRILIIVQLLLLVAAALAGAIERRFLPQALRSYKAEEPSGVSRHAVLVACLGWTYASAYVTAVTALLRGRMWARGLYGASALLGFASRALLGPQIGTPIAGVFGSLYMACIGATIGFLLFSREAVPGGRSSEGGAKEAAPETGTAGQATRPATPAEEGRKSFLRGLVRNLKAGLRAAVFLKVDPSHLSVFPGQLLALAGVELVVSFLLSLAYTGANGKFNIDSLPSAVFYLPLMLVAAYWISRLEAREELRLSIPIALISAGLWIEMAGELADLASNDVWFPDVSLIYGGDHYYRFFGWWFLSSYLIVHRLAGPSRKQAPSRLVFALVLAVPFWFVPKWDLMTKPYNEHEADTAKASIASEEVFYAQPELLEETLSRIKPGRKGTVDLYFVGFGSDSTQDVFMKEIDAVKELFDDRFDTRGRSVALINNEQAVGRVPIATLTSLERTIDRVAQRMNRDEDILFLYLTSHGSEKHDLLVDFWPLRLNAIYPEDIREMLDHAGIRWRVVVVSACYSGGYVEPLKDDDTLVITSADAKHSSFGCSNDSDLTYFGKAYFDEALRRSYSFIRPFGEVKETILNRERKESETPSNPRIHVGAAIQKQLEKLENRLERTAVAQGKTL